MDRIKVEACISICECGNYGVGGSMDESDTDLDNNCCDKVVARIDLEMPVEVNLEREIPNEQVKTPTVVIGSGLDEKPKVGKVTTTSRVMSIDEAEQF